MVPYWFWDVLRDEIPKARKALEEIAKLMKENSDYRKAFGDPK